jgi:hypothetical protein
MARESRPFHRVLPLLDRLFRRSPMIVETNHALRCSAEIGHDEPKAGEEFSVVPFHFRDDAPLPAPCRSLVFELVVKDDRSLGRAPYRPRHRE